MTKKTVFKRLLSAFLCLALMLTYVPLSARMAVSAAAAETSVGGATATDPGTAHTWETMMGTDVDGNRYEIPDPMALDKKSYKRIELYI